MSNLQVEEIHEKYRIEREKRLRKDGVGQYVHMDGAFAEMNRDPWAKEPVSRDAVVDAVDAVIVGGGIASLLMAVNMQQAGLNRILFIDKAGDFGGTWYWNRYPGAQCDTESYVYLPLLEETGYIPTEKYAYQPEILEHLQRVARHFGLYKDTLFQTEVSGAKWRDDTSRWVVTTSRGDEITAKYLSIAPGRLQNPKLPGIKGIEAFQGETWHTGRWNSDYAGEKLVNLAGKRVGIIGTGATGIQVIPELAKHAEQLYVFQRTPAGAWIRGNKPTSDDFGADLTPGWQYRRMRNFTAHASGVLDPGIGEDLVADGWTQIAGWLSSPEGDPEANEFSVMERIRNRVDQIVKDPDTAAVLKPYYYYGCKRANFHDSYLNSLNCSHVNLVDTDGKGPDEITARGVVVGGKEYEVDCLVFASGYDLGMGFLYGTNLHIEGRDGQVLSEKWQDGLKTLHGMNSHGFPNLFFLGFTQTAFSVSFTHMAVEQTEHAAHLIAEAERRDATIEPTAEAERAYVNYVQSTHTPQMRAKQLACTPSSVNNEGNPDDPNTLGAGQYLPPGNAMFTMLEQWRAEGSFDGIEFAKRRAVDLVGAGGGGGVQDQVTSAQHRS